MNTRVCDVKHAKHLDSNLRIWVQNPEKILKGLIMPGHTVMDIGCGTGLFSVEMARMVGKTGKVIAVDLQQGMIDLAWQKAKNNGVLSRIDFHCCDFNEIDLKDKVDLILGFYMVHEVPDKMRFFAKAYDLLKIKGFFFIVEPWLFHVSKKDFLNTIALAQECGFTAIGKRKVVLSRGILLYKY